MQPTKEPAMGMTALDQMAQREFDRKNDPFLNYLEEKIFRIVMKAEERKRTFVRSTGHIETTYDEQTMEILDECKRKWELHMKTYYPEELPL